MQEKLLPVGWKLAQWVREERVNLLLSHHRRIWMSTWSTCLVDWLRFSQGVVSQSVSLLVTKGGKTMQNVYSNLYSQAVTHPSTNRSQPCLTSVIGRELVYSRWYGRRHQSRGKILMQKSKNAGQTHVTLGLKLILNPAARGRERVTSAPFNASIVRDHGKWIHHRQFFCWFKKQWIPFISWEIVALQPSTLSK